VKALPSFFYRDPAEVTDEVSEFMAKGRRMQEQERVHKSRRIKALTAQVLRRGGKDGGR